MTGEDVEVAASVAVAGSKVAVAAASVGMEVCCVCAAAIWRSINAVGDSFAERIVVSMGGRCPQAMSKNVNVANTGKDKRRANDMAFKTGIQ